MIAFQLGSFGHETSDVAVYLALIGFLARELAKKYLGNGNGKKSNEWWELKMAEIQRNALTTYVTPIMEAQTKILERMEEADRDRQKLLDRIAANQIAYEEAAKSRAELLRQQMTNLGN